MSRRGLARWRDRWRHVCRCTRRTRARPAAMAMATATATATVAALRAVSPRRRRRPTLPPAAQRRRKKRPRDREGGAICYRTGALDQGDAHRLGIGPGAASRPLLGAAWRAGGAAGGWAAASPSTAGDLTGCAALPAGRAKRAAYV